MEPTRNPYAPPTAVVADAPSARRGRPGWVWAICIVQTLGLLGGIASTYLMFTGQLPAEGPAATYFASLTTFDALLVGASLTLHAAGVVTLFLLRRVAFPIYAAGLGVGLLLLPYNLSKPGYSAMLSDNLFGTAAGWAINFAILFYVYHLQRNGTLK